MKRILAVLMTVCLLVSTLCLPSFSADPVAGTVPTVSALKKDGATVKSEDSELFEDGAASGVTTFHDMRFVTVVRSPANETETTALPEVAVGPEPGTDAETEAETTVHRDTMDERGDTGSIFSEGSLTMIVAIVALIASIASIIVNVTSNNSNNSNKKKDAPSAEKETTENDESIPR